MSDEHLRDIAEEVLERSGHCADDRARGLLVEAAWLLEKCAITYGDPTCPQPQGIIEAE